MRLAAAIGSDGNATVSTVKPGLHAIELRREQALPKKYDRTFKTGDVVLLSGPEVTLEKVTVDNRSLLHRPPRSVASHDERLFRTTAAWRSKASRFEKAAAL